MNLASAWVSVIHCWGKLSHQQKVHEVWKCLSGRMNPAALNASDRRGSAIETAGSRIGGVAAISAQCELPQPGFDLQRAAYLWCKGSTDSEGQATVT